MVGRAVEVMVASNEVKSPESASAAMIAKKRTDFFVVAGWVPSSPYLLLCFLAIVPLEETSPVAWAMLSCSSPAAKLLVYIAWALVEVSFDEALAAIKRANYESQVL